MSLFFVIIGVVFVLLGFFAGIKPNVINDINKKLSSNYTSKEKDALVKSFIVPGVLCFVIAIGINACSGDAKSDKPKEAEKPKTEAELRQEKVEHCFSGWDGSHTVLSSAIKQSMNDPDSYEHVETRWKEKEKTLIVSTKFRGKNAFGAKIINEVIAETDIDTCGVIKIIKQ